MSDAEVSRLTAAQGELDLTIKSFKSQMDTLKIQLKEALENFRLKDEQLRASKANNAQLSLALQQFEQSDKSEVNRRKLLEDRAAAFESTVNTLESLKASQIEVQEELSLNKAQLRLLQEDKLSLEAKVQLLHSELEGSKHRVVGLESRNKALKEEKEKLLTELSETKAALSLSRVSFEDEHKKKILLERSLEALRKTEEEQRNLLVKG